jgi:choline/glycine/proline betaine transport protein
MSAPHETSAHVPTTAEEASGGRAVAPRVFWPAAALIGVFVLASAAFPDVMSTAISAVQGVVIDGFGWYYVLLIAAFVAFSAYVAFSRYGDLRLGPDDEAPEFGLRSWFAMLFSAGMGIGLVFWGVAEPLNHFASPRPGFEGTANEAAVQAMTTTYLHWGIHAWAIYVVVGLAIAYAVHRRGRPVSIRWALEPILGEKTARGPVGDVVDVIAVVGTVFGVATSLGLGVLQLSAGLGFVGVPVEGLGWQVLLIALITGLAVLSVVTGLAKGIRVLSNVNMVLAGFVLLFVLVAGPTLFLLREFVASLGTYATDVLRLTFDTSPLQGEDGQAWQASWTTFYWGWWMSWAPFVGVFIARISRGRTVRQFVVGVLAVPTLLTFLWFSVLGGTALHRELFGAGGLVDPDGAVDTNLSLFLMLDGLPLGSLVAVVVLVLIVTFFVTSSDSGSLVVDMLASGGNTNPPVWSRVMWAVLEGAVAAALLAIGTLSGSQGGALTALQTMAVVIALPFSFVMVLMMIGTLRAFKREWAEADRDRRRLRQRRMTNQIASDLNLHDWQDDGDRPVDPEHVEVVPAGAERSGRA